MDFRVVIVFQVISKVKSQHTTFSPVTSVLLYGIG